jgi:enamine deaminase RidA (YjgF/YER057c/UK114 family)
VGTVAAVNDAERTAGLAPTPGYRYADVVDDRIFVAGQVPLDASGGLVAPGDAAGQARACLDNLRTLVGVHGCSMHAVHHLAIHVVGGRDVLVEAWDAVRDWFGGEVPPATLLGTTVLGYDGQLVEIDATVVADRPPTG